MAAILVFYAEIALKMAAILGFGSRIEIIFLDI